MIYTLIIVNYNLSFHDYFVNRLSIFWRHMILVSLLLLRWYCYYHVIVIVICIRPLFILHSVCLCYITYHFFLMPILHFAVYIFTVTRRRRATHYSVMISATNITLYVIQMEHFLNVFYQYWSKRCSGASICSSE